MRTCTSLSPLATFHPLQLPKDVSQMASDPTLLILTALPCNSWESGISFELSEYPESMPHCLKSLIAGHELPGAEGLRRLYPPIHVLLGLLSLLHITCQFLGTGSNLSQSGNLHALFPVFSRRWICQQHEAIISPKPSNHNSFLSHPHRLWAMTSFWNKKKKHHIPVIQSEKCGS